MIQKEIKVRNYFSYSQFSAFKYSKKQFLDNYYYGKRDDDNIYFKVGNELGDALRFRDVKRNKILEKIKTQIPPAEIYEQKIYAEFKGINLLAYLDGFFPKNYILDEYKSGKKPSESSWKNQILFYSIILFLNKKKLPKKINLYWAETKFDKKGKLKLTGNVRKYDMTVKIEEVLMFSKELVDTYNKILKLCQDEYEKFGILPVNGSAKGGINTKNKIKK